MGRRRTGRRRSSCCMKGSAALRSGATFRQKLAAATGHGVFAYSRAGYGGSEPVDLPRPLDYMSREARFSLPAALDAIGLRRGILLGHSDGASIAAIYAGEHAGRADQGPRPDGAASVHRTMGLASIAEARRSL